MTPLRTTDDFNYWRHDSKYDWMEFNPEGPKILIDSDDVEHVRAVVLLSPIFWAYNWFNLIEREMER